MSILSLRAIFNENAIFYVYCIGSSSEFGFFKERYPALILDYLVDNALVYLYTEINISDVCSNRYTNY